MPARFFLHRRPDMTLAAELGKPITLPKSPRDRVRGRASQLSPSALLPFLLPLTIVLLWQAAASFGWITNRLMPAPIQVVWAFWDKLSSGQLLVDIRASAIRAISGLLVGGPIGFLLGLANGVSRLSHALTDTTLQMLRTIPNLALIPLVILWFGIGEEAKLFLTALGVFFPIYLNTLHGVRNVDPQLIEMGRVYGMSGWTLFRKGHLPRCITLHLCGPALLAGHHVADAHRRRDHGRLIGHRPHGQFGPRIHDDRRGDPGARHLCPARQARRRDRTDVGAADPLLEPRLSKASEELSHEHLNPHQECLGQGY
jgi:ABC-type nitrate/sulfonate/bicarbonate transport system permease component